VYFNVNFNTFFKLIKVNLLVSALYIYQNVRCNDKKKTFMPDYEIWESQGNGDSDFVYEALE